MLKNIWKGIKKSSENLTQNYWYSTVCIIAGLLNILGENHWFFKALGSFLIFSGLNTIHILIKQRNRDKKERK